MAELATQERLQPSLLDRLADRARYKEQLWLAIDDLALEKASVSRAQLLQALQAHGIAPAASIPKPVPSAKDSNSSGELFETLAGPRALNRALGAVVAHSADKDAIKVADVLRVTDRKAIANLQESREERVISSRQLRSYVLRDLVWLLNTGNLATVVDMTPFTRAQKSVLNYGIPDVAGSIASEVDASAIATAIQEAIEAFEPRLRQVRVTAADKKAEHAGNELNFVIEAALWAHTAPEQLFLRTELDLETANVSIREMDTS